MEVCCSGDSKFCVFILQMFPVSFWKLLKLLDLIHRKHEQLELYWIWLMRRLFNLHLQLWRVNSCILVWFKQSFSKNLYFKDCLYKLQGKSTYVNLLLFGHCLTALQCSTECICKKVIAQIIQKRHPWHVTAFPEK